MILKDINRLYDIKLYYYNGVSFSNRYIINVLDWYSKYADDEMTVVYYDEEFEDVKIRKFSFGAILTNYKRDDVLLVFREEHRIKFEIMTERGDDVL